MKESQLLEIIRQEIRKILQEGKSKGKYLGHMYPGSPVEKEDSSQFVLHKKVTTSEGDAFRLAEKVAKSEGVDTYVVSDNILSGRWSYSNVMKRKRIR